ncbi:hypothetical protein [Paraburkholderia caballeronis]|uniref:Uncharacterized protein n=1 Tax=Paraburkholderia caballeronis TaxID=416943 RepID=A0A1H7F7W6_9BURK|nr:hypothetical protein [Paraburkholderia caballeronis]PXW23986.1 hypothetical protein C7403_108145 [Paraburkholderia caballeronis]PXW99750.1 hypothetical protein C7407_108145 [Paraburkholderia caballeronis]RAJ96704.1 hypothetical protein C7409_108145 [Paraburkholderia caballeronis]TDV26885.1 hypothetical protein C7405_11894 [Paraburkholderia caballeronis]SEE76524.1 hypothetical protein SAMN05445871_6081 [Paraburkholderia caballeronis]
MIYVIEQWADGKPRAWFAYDDADFARKVAASDPLPPEAIYDVATLRELLEFSGPSPDADTRAKYPSLCAIGEAGGWDAPLYRADYLLGRGVCQSGLVTPRDASLAALEARGDCVVYWNDDDAIAAFEGADPRIAGDSHWLSRRALYEQLVALEVLADDN